MIKQVTYLSTLLTVVPLFAMAQSLWFIKEEGGIRIKEGESNVLFYQVAPKSINGQFERAHYIHPLYGTDGAVLTEDFPADHLHHRGIFWAWHQVIVGDRQLGDAWECRDFNWDVSHVEIIPSDSTLLLQSKVIWKSPEYVDHSGIPLPILEEECSIRIFPRRENYRVIDFDIILQPLAEEVRLGGSQDEKGYGGFSVRLKMPDDLAFTSESGKVVPEVTAVKAANWIIVSGSMGKNAEQAGVVLISRNAFDKAGTNWILRRKESMQNAVFPGRNPIILPKGQAFELRYSMIVFEGTLEQHQLNNIVEARSGHHE